MAYPSTSGMVQPSSSLHGSIRRDPEGYDMPSDLDQALLLYFDGQQQAKSSIQEQQPQTLNIFPSQPMHFEPSPKGSMASSVAGAQVAGPSKTSPAPPPKAGGGPLGAGKSSKASIKREGSAGGKHGGGAGPSSSDQEGPRTPDPKTLRRLAQNREAARKSRLRKKAYIQQLESGRIRLAHLEQEMQMARTHHQGAALWGTGTLSPDAALFNLEYERWLGDHSKVVAQLRAAAEEHRPDGELRAYADEAASHYGALMGLKARLAAADPLYLLSGLWKGAAERCFLWIGGFRPSELIKVYSLSRSLSLSPAKRPGTRQLDADGSDASLTRGAVTRNVSLTTSQPFNAKSPRKT
ncbi:hypothetical protein GQ55_4G083200 [Panicum hallii var. hallii]|uniref:BZIP domain-containing protein n=1 Tax=Panicum hallii var. hallii TaxID=1504633 RepID=A0A2T7DWI6_9POAL|nr:hypothetical protein GQ55_4G083200 [Panicum hallii var. hallii]